MKRRMQREFDWFPWLIAIIVLVMIGSLIYSVKFASDCHAKGGTPVFARGTWPLCVKSSMLINL